MVLLSHQYKYIWVPLRVRREISNFPKTSEGASKLAKYLLEHLFTERDLIEKPFSALREKPDKIEFIESN